MSTPGNEEKKGILDTTAGLAGCLVFIVVGFIFAIYVSLKECNNTRGIEPRWEGKK